jgi:hypothetical protein
MNLLDCFLYFQIGIGVLLLEVLTVIYKVSIAGIYFGKTGI